MEENIEIAQNLGYLQIPRGLIRKVGPGMEKLPDREVVILTTGSQGEERASLARMGLGTHQHVRIKRGDTVILSSNPILGNERAVAKVVNNLNLLGAHVVTNQELALHTTGHGFQNDILLMHRLVRAKHIIPEHGEPYMRAAHAELARSIGYPENRIHLLTNGEILEFDNQGNARKSKHKIMANDIVIDGRGAGAEGQRTMDDRRVMSNAGIFIAVLKIYSDSMRLVSDPLLLSRGLIYGSEQGLINKEATAVIRKAYEEAAARGEKNIGNLKREVTGALFRYFRKKLDREPMVMPVLIEV
jgi:ribonuclease J